jgi:hypothetical protein
MKHNEIDWTFQNKRVWCEFLEPKSLNYLFLCILCRSSEEDIGHMNASATNENVTFREKKDYSHLGFTYLGDRSPVETTTEL